MAESLCREKEKKQEEIVENKNRKGVRDVSPLWVLFLIISMVCEQIANILAKQFAITGRRLIAALSIIGFILTNIPWIASLRSGLDLSQGAIIFLILNSVSAVVIGIVFYREKITLSQLVGLALGLVALVFLSL